LNTDYLSNQSNHEVKFVYLPSLMSKLVILSIGNVM